MHYVCNGKKERLTENPQTLANIGTPGMIRTCDPLIRSQVLYPAELRVRESEHIEYKRGRKAVKQPFKLADGLRLTGRNILDVSGR